MTMENIAVEVYQENSLCMVCGKCINLLKEAFMCTKDFHGQDTPATLEFQYVFGDYWDNDNLSNFSCEKCTALLQALFSVKNELLKLFKTTNKLDLVEKSEDSIENTVDSVKKSSFKSAKMGLNNKNDYTDTLFKDSDEKESETDVENATISNSNDELLVENDIKTTYVNVETNLNFKTEEDNSMDKVICEESSTSSEKSKKTKSRSKKKIKTKEEAHAEKLCTICQKVFSSRFAMSNHMKTHSAEKRFCCPICGKMFAFEYYLNKHVKRHTAPKSYSCAYCDKSFKDMWCLKSHERIHTGERPFACGFCEKRFVTLDKKQIHERLHTGHRPYKCSYCDRCFNERAVCARHQLSVHLKVGAYQCKLCDQSFTTRTNLNNHKKTHEKTTISYVCNVCGQTFGTDVDFQNHEASHHIAES